jgi:uncharacterized membrane protein YccC
MNAHSMRLMGFLLLLAGWAIVLTAAALLKSAVQQTSFVLAGFGVEVLGFVLVARTHLIPRAEKG